MSTNTETIMFIIISLAILLAITIFAFIIIRRLFKKYL